MTPKNSRVPVELLEECYQRLRAGESITACLERYSEYAAQLGPQLQAIASVRQARPMPARNPIVAAHARAQFVEAAMRMASSPVPVERSNRLVVAWENLLQSLSQALSGLRPVPAGLVLTLSIVFLLGLLATRTVTVAATAMPGQFLYPVKLAAEQARLRLALDPTTHSAVAAQIDENRRAEARQILAQRLRVDRMAFAGVVESMRAGRWAISGLPVLITGESVVDSAIQVGDYVRGEVRAPGDGTLVALKLSVDKAVKSAPSGSARPAPVTVAVSAAAVEVTPTPSPSAILLTLASPPAIPTVSTTAGEKGLPVDSIVYPLPTRAPKATATPTRTPKPNPTPTPSLTPLRTVTYGRIIDVVRDIQGSRWTIGAWVVDTNADTQYISSPGLGDNVDCSVALMPDGSTLALSIRALRDAPPPVKFDVTGMVNSMGSTRWDVDGTIFTIDGDTLIDSGSQLDDYVNVQAERLANGENHALHIIKLVEGTTQFSGPIEYMSNDHWVIMGHAVTTDAKTVYIGGPAAVGRIADVDALILPDSLVARTIYVHIDTPTPTDTPTDTPVEQPPTDTPTPPPTPPKPTRTPTPLPTRDVSALPHAETGGGRA